MTVIWYQGFIQNTTLKLNKLRRIIADFRTRRERAARAPHWSPSHSSSYVRHCFSQARIAMAVEKYLDDKDPYGHPRIPYRGHYDREHCDLRRGWVEQFTSCSLKQVGQWWDGEGEEDSRSCLRLKGNIENPIGLVKLPVAVAGPLLVKGKYAHGHVLAPCATTEGALVASITRGAAALTRAGGVHTLATEKVMIRTPSFITRNAGESEQLWQWLQSHKDDLQKQVC